MGERRRMADLTRAGLALLLALVVAGLRPALAAGPLLSISAVRTDGFPEIAVIVTATDANGLPLTGLDRDRFRVTHNGVAVPDFTLQKVDADQEGVAAVLAVDTSGSMAGRSLAGARAAAHLFVDNLGPHDRAALIDFGDQVNLTQDFTDDRAALGQAIDGLAARGDTALYDALFQAATLVAAQPVGRRALVVITDGEDTLSNVTLDDVVAKVREVSTPVYALGFGEVKPEPLRRLATVSGGGYLEAPSGDRLTDGIKQVGEILRTQYVLRYQAPDSRGDANSVQVTLTQDGQQVADSRRFGTPPLPVLDLKLDGVTAGARLNGPVELRAVLSGAPRADRVEYLLDGQPLGSSTEPPYLLRWDTSRATGGAHELVAQARVGLREARQAVSITVVPPLQASIRQPAPGVDLTGSVKLAAEVQAGPAAKVSVEWTVDGRTVGRADRAPYEVDWNSADTPSGEHTLRLTVQDEFSAVRVERAIHLAAPLPTVAPTAPARPTSVTSPASGTTWEWSREGLLLGALILVVAAAVLLRNRATRKRAVDENARTAALVLDSAALPAPRAGAVTWEESASWAGPSQLAAPPTGSSSSDETVARSDRDATVVLTPRGTLVVTTPGQPEQRWPLQPGEILVGREPGPGGVIIPDARASRQHGRLTWVNGRWLYADEQARNPTLINGRPLEGHHQLRDGDQLLIGRSEVIFKLTVV
jgi:VWFA-related protein